MRIGICDDEKIYRDYIKKLCIEYFKIKNTSYEILEFNSSEEFLSSQQDLQILLLDIEMKGIDGITTKNILSDKKCNVKIIFISSHNEEMENAFGKYVYGFLVKPFKLKSLYNLMDKVIKDIGKEFVVEVDFNGKKKYIKGDDILYIEAEDKYSLIHTVIECYLLRRSMSEWEILLKEQDFYRVHKSYIVNLAFIKQFDDFITLENNIKIKLSKRNAKLFKYTYYDYLKREAK